MPTVSLSFDSPPERVWEVLAQPRHYASWVVGSHAIQDHDASWPAAGATFSHTQGRPPLALSDTTTVLRSEPPTRLELEVRARPLLIAHVTLTAAPERGGSRVVMEEEPVAGWLERPLRLRLAAALVRARNLESLRRLKRLAEGGEDTRAATGAG